MTQVYFRSNVDNLEELLECAKQFKTVPCRTKLDGAAVDPTVICRYSALPFNRELEEDLINLGLRPINSSHEHSYIANMDWIHDLNGMTFPTWDRLNEVPGDFPLIVKGRTNSKKFEWNTKMYAATKRRAAEIAAELYNDPLLGPQGLVFRKYVPLKTYEIGVNDMPMTNEWRCFFLGENLVDAGFYWSIIDELGHIDRESFDNGGLQLAMEAAKIVAVNARFFVIDVAQGEDGKWWVVEINDGQMSGLSTIPEDRFYQNLRIALENENGIA